MAERIERDGVWWERDDGGNWWSWDQAKERWELSAGLPRMKYFRDCAQARNYARAYALPMLAYTPLAVLFYVAHVAWATWIGIGLLLPLGLYTMYVDFAGPVREIRRDPNTSGWKKVRILLNTDAAAFSRGSAWDEVRWLCGWSKRMLLLVQYGPYVLAMVTFFLLLSDPATRDRMFG
jgi:hypothetical protein